MQLKRTLSAIAAVAVTAGLAIVPTAGAASASEPAPDASRSARPAIASLGGLSPSLRINCVRIATDMDGNGEDSIWICTIVW